MRDEGLGREVLRLAVPAFGALVAPSLLIITDSAFVGTLGTDALAALATGGAIFGAAVGLSYFLAYATTSVVARRYGAGQEREAIGDGVNYITLGLIIGGLIAGLLWFSAETFSRWIGASPTVVPLAVEWLHAVAIGAPATMAAMATIGLFRGLQDTRVTLYVTTVQVALNIVLCAWLVFGLDWGVFGAGLATAIAEVTGFLLYLAVLARHARRVHARFYPTHLRGIGRAMLVGLPLLWRTVALRTVLIGTTIVSARLGTEELAAFNVSLQLWYVLANLLDAIAIAAQAIIGRRLGASEGHLVHDIVRRLVRWSAICGTVVGAITVVLAPIAPALFSNDPVVRQLLTTCLLIIGLHQPLAALVFLLDGVLIGSGDSRFLALTVTAALATFLPIAWAVLHWQLGVVGLWFAMIAFLTTRVAFMLHRAKGDAWIVEGATR